MITVQVTGDDAVVARLAALPGRVAAKLRAAIQRAVFLLVAAVKGRKLSGQVLKVRTGRLRRSVNGRVVEAPGLISGQAGTNVAYAAAHEHGFTGVVTVKAHLRTIKEAFGRAITPVAAAVAEHTRHMQLPERSFLRSALRELAPEIRQMLAGAVAEGLRA